ncbi:MAG: potassium channel protein [Proteobacteria bacterium]|nr:potassium channel protein [Pseudomonadota bacterium]
MNDILWLTMRRMRLPLILLLLVFGISMFGMMLIPGIDAEGNVYHLNFLEAAYFVAFMSTTIGFGEIPYAFTDAQRLFVFSVIYLNVGTWLYSAGTILGLFLDARFRAVMTRSRFSRRIEWLGDPFYIVCGLGDTGEQIILGLEQRNLHASIIEIREDRLHSLQLHQTISDFPMLNADAGNKEALMAAGLKKDNCLGVITTTNDDHTNLKIAITAKLLFPDKTVLARCESETIAANMESFGTNYVIDPYEIFAERLELAIHSSVKYLVQDWLIAVPGTELRKEIKPPDGRWIICGLGRFGSKVARRMLKAGVDITVIDVREHLLEEFPSSVQGRGTEAHTLREAGIEDAVGIIAGTGDDVDNLSIIMTARDLNPDLFFVGRQEKRNNDDLFKAAKADLIARRSHIVARRILALVTTPLLRPFLEFMIHQKDSWAQRLEHQLKAVLKGHAPNLWLVDIRGVDAEGLRICRKLNISVNIGDLSHNTRLEENQHLSCLCLVLERGSQRIFLPGDDYEIKEGDRLLFAGRSSARKEMFWTLSDPNRLLSYSAGVNLPRGAIWRWWYKKKNLK